MTRVIRVAIVNGHSDAKVVTYSWNLEPKLIARAVEAGACGYPSKALTGPVRGTAA